MDGKIVVEVELSPYPRPFDVAEVLRAVANDVEAGHGAGVVKAPDGKRVGTWEVR